MRASVLFLGLLSLAVVALADFDKPTLIWGLGGSCGYSCQRGWYSSPAVATDPVSGEKLIVSAAYDVYCMYGSNGTTRWSAQSPGGGRVWPGIVIVDLDKDSKLEVVTAFGGGWVSAYNLTDGAIYYPNFPYQPSGVDDEFRALAVADINQDAGMEILLGRAYSGNTNTYGLTYYGSPIPGYPLGTDQSKGYTWGVYNSNLGIADMDNDGKYEVISPSDVHYVCTYYADGTPYPCNSQYAANGGRTNWGQVGFYYNVTWEDQGYGPCGSTDPAIRTNFANGPVVIADLDNDGTNEYVFTGRTYFCNDESPDFVGLHITKADRTRWKNTAKGYDWTTLPAKPTDGPLSIGNYDTIEDTQFNAAVGNLDGDANGELEIVYPAWDGKMHAFWLDQSVRGYWPFDMKTLSSTSDIVFGTEPVIVDIDNDGKAEVIFGTWTTKTSNDYGYLVVLDSSGNLVYKIPLDAPLNNNAKWNGILACPTVANIDSDPNLEVVVLTAYSGTLAYRLHNSTNAKIHWGTSRGNQQRTASVTLPTVGPGSPPPASINSGVSTLIASWVAVVEYLLRFFL